MSSLSTAIGNATANFTNSVASNGTNALGQLAQGNLEGAVSTLAQAPGEALNAVITGGAAAAGNGFGGLNARSDAIQNWCWYCSMPTLNNSSALQINTGIPFLGSVGPVVALPWYYVQTANLPTREFQTDSIQRNGHAIHYPESYLVQDLSLGLFMDTSGKAWQYITAWQGLVMGNQSASYPGNQGAWGLPAKYKKDIQIIVLSASKKQMLTMRYINCFPKNVSPLTLVNNASDALVAEIVFTVEDVDVTVSNDLGLINNILNTATGYAMGALSNVASSVANNISESVNNFLS
jgi:hypothetical protein